MQSPQATLLNRCSLSVYRYIYSSSGPSLVPVARYSACEIVWHRWENTSSGNTRSSAGCRYSTGTSGWHIGALWRNHCCSLRRTGSDLCPYIMNLKCDIGDSSSSVPSTRCGCFIYNLFGTWTQPYSHTVRDSPYETGSSKNSARSLHQD